MDRVRLGRTSLMVSPVGLGCGGYSRLGMRDGNDTKTAENVVRHALELGVNYFDTARVYGTEEVVGNAVAAQRDQVVIGTKTMFRDRDDNYLPVGKLIESLEKSLGRLKSDYVDVFSFHGVTPEHMGDCIDRYVPALQRQIDLGKIRHLGITESFRQDPTHKMLEAAIPSGCFDVVMVGFNFLNAGARDNVFPLSIKHEVGTLVMHAVRRALSNTDALLETIDKLIESGEVFASKIDAANPLGFLTGNPAVQSVVEAAYRYCRHEPGVSVVLTGTGSTEHLSHNVAALTAPPLPDELHDKLNDLFGGVRSISGD